MMKLLSLSTLFTLSFSAFAQQTPTAAITVSGEILGYTLSSEGLKLQVKTGGCISKSNFGVMVRQSYPSQITITQTSKDSCRAYLPDGMPVTFSFAEFGLQSGDVVSVDVLSSSSFTID